MSGVPRVSSWGLGLRYFAKAVVARGLNCRNERPGACWGHKSSSFKELPLSEPTPPEFGAPVADMGPGAHSELFAGLYEELHQIAQRELRRGSGLALSATTLLHEAYLKVQQRDGVAFPDRHRFLAYASRVMRNLVIDFARRRQAQKRGGAFEITSLPTLVPEQAADVTELERLGTAIDALESLDAALAQLVNLKFFCGLSFIEIAAMRGVSERTVQRDWEKARVLLQRALEGRELLPD
jgi:RNA polymerase sigma factor (TIGR02999 family)